MRTEWKDRKKRNTLAIEWKKEIGIQEAESVRRDTQSLRGLVELSGGAVGVGQILNWKS